MREGDFWGREGEFSGGEKAISGEQMGDRQGKVRPVRNRREMMDRRRNRTRDDGSSVSVR